MQDDTRLMEGGPPVILLNQPRGGIRFVDILAGKRRIKGLFFSFFFWEGLYVNQRCNKTNVFLINENGKLRRDLHASPKHLIIAFENRRDLISFSIHCCILSCWFLFIPGVLAELVTRFASLRFGNGNIIF